MAAEIVLIAAAAANGAIGLDGRLPWHLPADLKRFKALTMGKPMIMGRKTFASFPAPLPGRRHIVLTRDPAWHADGAEVAHSPEHALALAGEGEIAVIGGADIFSAFLPGASRLELTEVHADIPGDTFLPPIGSGWREESREEHPAAAGRPAFAFVTLVRETPARLPEGLGVGQ
jgi:dihydrofolate reductase